MEEDFEDELMKLAQQMQEAVEEPAQGTGEGTAEGGAGGVGEDGAGGGHALQATVRAKITSAVALALTFGLRYHDVFNWHSKRGGQMTEDQIRMFMDDAEEQGHYNEEEGEYPSGQQEDGLAHEEEDLGFDAFLNQSGGADDGEPVEQTGESAEMTEDELEAIALKEAKNWVQETRLKLMRERLQAVFGFPAKEEGDEEEVAANEEGETMNAPEEAEEDIGRFDESNMEAEELIAQVITQASQRSAFVAACGQHVPWIRQPQGVFHQARRLRNDAARAQSIPFQLEITHATAKAMQCCEKVSRNVYDIESWLDLLFEIKDLPLTYTRHVWHAFLFFFPTHSDKVKEYVLKEEQYLKGPPQHNVAFSDGDMVEDCRKSFICRYRILETYHHHLTVCQDVELYHMFFNFVQNYVSLDVDEYVECFSWAMENVIGTHPKSTDLWSLFIEKKSERIRDRSDRGEFVRTTYKKLLKLPMADLDKMLERYKEVEEDLNRHRRGGWKIESELEQRCTLAQAEYRDREKYWGECHRVASGGYVRRRNERRFLDPQERGLTRLVPRPLRPLPRDRFSEKELEPATSDARIVGEWQLWYAFDKLLFHERDTESDPAKTMHRLALILHQRTVAFPHQVQAWVDLLDHYISHSKHMQRPERLKETEALFYQALAWNPDSLLIHFMFADFCHEELKAAGKGKGLFRQLVCTLSGSMIRRFQDMLALINHKPPPHLPKVAHQRHQEAVSETMEKLVQLNASLFAAYSQWMKYCRLCFRNNGDVQMRLVAKHAMKVTKVMQLLEKCMQLCSHVDGFLPNVEGPSANRFILPFNQFCQLWVECELKLNPIAIASGCDALRAWANVLQQVVLMAAERRAMRDDQQDKLPFFTTCSGIDSAFFSAARELCLVDPNHRQEVLEIVYGLAALLPHPELISLRVCKEQAKVIGANTPITLLSSSENISSCSDSHFHAALAHSNATLRSSVVDGLQQWRWMLQLVARVDPTLEVSRKIDAPEMPAVFLQLKQLRPVDLIKSAMVALEPTSVFMQPTQELNRASLRSTLLALFGAGLLQGQSALRPSVFSGMPDHHAIEHASLAKEINASFPSREDIVLQQIGARDPQELYFQDELAEHDASLYFSGAAAGYSNNYAAHGGHKRKAHISKDGTIDFCCIDDPMERSKTIAVSEKDRSLAGKNEEEGEDIAADMEAQFNPTTWVVFDPETAVEQTRREMRNEQRLEERTAAVRAAAAQQTNPPPRGGAPEPPAQPDVAARKEQDAKSTSNMKYFLDSVNERGMVGRFKNEANLEESDVARGWGKRPVYDLENPPAVIAVQSKRSRSLRYVLDTFKLQKAEKKFKEKEEVARANGLFPTKQQREELEEAERELFRARAALNTKDYASIGDNKSCLHLSQLLTQELPPLFAIAPLASAGTSKQLKSSWLVEEFTKMDAIEIPTREEQEKLLKKQMEEEAKEEQPVEASVEN